jgi:3-hydroxybutyryl-CoA dehydrogenase
MAEQEKLVVLGTGTMGHSIALSAALAGMSVNVWGQDQEDIERGRKGIAEKLQVLLRYDAIRSSESEAIKERVTFTCELDECVRDATFLIEAIPEDLALKQEWFRSLDEQCPTNVILASNTSGLSPTDIALHTVHKERMIVTHFWNPAHLIPLVEVVRGTYTSDATVDRTLALLHKMNKKPVVLKKEILGSIGNRLQFALFREAQNILEQGVATVEDIDAAVRYSIGRRLPVTGVFMSADMGGLDVFDSISNYLFPDLSTQQESLPTMRRLVDEGKYGQKNGEGFYRWTPEFSQKMNEERERELIEWLKKDFDRA